MSPTPRCSSGRPLPLVFLAGMLVVALSWVVSAGAQTTPSLPSTPAPSDCTVKPLPLPLWKGTQPAVSPTAPVSVAGHYVPPSGEPVDDATAQAIVATLTQAIACENAGDIPRMLALFTPDRVQAFFAGPRGFDAEAVEATAAVPATPRAEGQRIALVWVQTPMRLDDGRVGTLVTTAAGSQLYTDFVYLAQGADGSWLIDASIAINSQTQSSGAGTVIP